MKWVTRTVDPQLVRQLAVLELHAEPLGQLVPVVPGVEPEDADLATVRGSQPLDAFHGRGLACAVGPEDPEDLARLDRKGDVVDGHGVPVALVQLPHLDHW
jgi:hypothetical protein